MSAWSATGQGSFTPTSVLMPIRFISISTADGTGGSVYSCAADSESGCMVDIADQAALDALVASSTISIADGTYTQVSIGTCKSETGYSAKIKGSVTLGAGQTPYVTSPTEALSTAGTADYISASFSGCKATFQLPTPLVITKSSDLTVSLFVSLKNIAWGSLNGAAIPSGCTTVSGKSVCMAYPHVVPYVGVTTPTLEIYHLRKTSEIANSESGQVLLFFDPSDNMLGGTTRRLYSETSISLGSYFDTPLHAFSKNADSTYHLENSGDSATNSELTFPSFSRAATHTGTWTDHAGVTANYTATKQ